MAVYGYNRTSTRDQHLDRGNKAIRDFCAQQGLDLIEIYSDQQTGKSFDRPEYRFIQKRLLPDDTLIISEVDRLGRNKLGILNELRLLKERNVRVMILEIPTTLTDLRGMDDHLARMILDTITNMLIEIYATFAEAEMHKRAKRQREGYERLRRNNEWDKLGRPAAIDFERFAIAYRKVVSGELKPGQCMKLLGISSSTYYRYKAQFVKTYPADTGENQPGRPGAPQTMKDYR